MAFDVEDLTTFYSNLPSIFESEPSNSIERSSNATDRINDNENTYRPMFSSFLFADSEPFTRAAFVVSTSPSIEVIPTQAQRLDENSGLQEINLLHSNHIQTTSLPPLAPVEDIEDDDDDEDDFDGIPIRHASTMIMAKLNDDRDSLSSHSEHNNFLDKFIHHVENDDDDEDRSFLNDFQDEQQQNDTTTIPSLFKDIPDIDDLNIHEEDDDRIPFDHMDVLDQSDSIRSSSPDSLLSSSHLRDEDDEEEQAMNNNDDDDVTQWNDDFLLRKSTSQNDRPNAPLPPPIILNMHPFDQVDFIDSSRSNSRCSNDSSHLSLGYADQEKIFINEDGLVTSSDSDSDRIHFENDILDCDDDNNDELSLQVNLDYHRSRSSSRSSYRQSCSTRSPSPIPDQSPIVAIDEDINDEKTIQSAPIAIVDDDDDLETFTSDQPVLPIIPLRNPIEFKTDKRHNDIVRDIVNIRYLLNEHDNDDEFIAVMHNPTIFEEVLFDNDDQQKSDLVKQTNLVTNNSQIKLQLSIDHKIENESLEHYENLQETSSTNKPNRPSNIITTNIGSPPPINHFLIEKEKVEENVSMMQSASMKQKKVQQSQEKNTTNYNINSEEEQPEDYYQMMSSDDESDNDLELLTTLSQLHGLVHSPRLSSEIIQNLDETDTLHKKIQQNEEKSNFMFNLASTSDIDEKENNILFNNDYNDEEQKKTYERKEEKKPSILSSLILSNSSASFDGQESNSTDSNLDSDGSSSLITSMNELNQVMIDDLQITNINNDDLLQQITTTTTTENNDSNCNNLWNQSMSHVGSSNKDSLCNQNDLTNYTSHSNIHMMTMGIHHDLFPSDDIQQQHENMSFSSFDIEVKSIVDELVSNTLRSVLNEIGASDQTLSETIYEDNNILTEHLASIINWHHQQSTINERLSDPFDSAWIHHFETPDDHNPIYSNIFDESNLFYATLNPTSHIQEMMPSPLLMNPFDSTFTPDDFMKNPLTSSVRNVHMGDNSIFQADFTLYNNESSIATDEKINEELTQTKDLSETKNEDVVEATTTTTTVQNESDSSSTDDDDETNGQENFFENKSTFPQFEAFASDQPLNTPGIDSITAGIENEFDKSSQIQDSTTSTEQQSEMIKTTPGDDEPWELEDSGEQKIKPIPTSIIQKNHSYNNFFPNAQTSESDGEGNDDEDGKENYDDYFSKNQSTEHVETSIPKNVRFDDDNIENVAVLTPKDSLDRSESLSTPDDDDPDGIDDEDITTNLQMVSDRIADHMNAREIKNNNNEPTEVTAQRIIPRPESEISLTDSEDLPPPLPPLPPLNKKSNTPTDNIPSKSSPPNIDLKRKINLRSEPEITPTIQVTTDAKLYSTTDTQLTRSFDSAILRSTSKDIADIDPDEVNDVISCTIDNNQVNIDAKTISPFKCVIGSAGQLEEDNQTAIIAIYGCWLPDRRLREYRYIMDQLFYYVYHKLEKLVTTDYILIYFHGATPKHRTPDFHILRKYYQMINFRLRKNLRAVYVIHPTRWLRTVIALSRPFFSKKFYHKVNYMYTIAELERQFPHNHITLPVPIEQTDWLYSQKYDRLNASIKRSIERSVSRPTSGIEYESAA